MTSSVSKQDEEVRRSSFSEFQPLTKKPALENGKTVANDSSTAGRKISKKLTKNKKGRVKRKYTQKNYDPTNPFGVLLLEVEELFTENGISEEKRAVDINLLLNSEDLLAKYNRNLEEVKVSKLTSSGDGLALIPHPEIEDGFQAVVIPFAYPGETVDIRIFRTHPTHAEADLLKVREGSEMRDNDLINCKYYGKCSGCQFQNVEYTKQLELKRKTIENAYHFFAKTLKAANALPKISDTVPSPLQYNYRTKLTPHFDLPRGKFNPEMIDMPALGFGAKGRPTWRESVQGGNKSVLDVEDCAIGTSVLNKAMSNEREIFKRIYKTKVRGGTILLRENTRAMKNDLDEEQKKKFINEENGSKIPDTEDNVYDEAPSSKEGETLIKTCCTDSKQIVSENIEGREFRFSANEFFQNNNSILPIVTKYVRDNLKFENSESEDRYLVDAYCGSGLFSIMCSDGVKEVCGVEVSKDSVAYANENAKLNNIQNAKFILGKAEQIFDDIKFPSALTSVICDPPRKGCDEPFLTQLSKFHPSKIVYISCNVHSQARDLEFFINNTENGSQYQIESIRGFDFFPQTHHIESIAILSLKK
ncbi:tRNA (uracil(54)-C(5))-methyltransferase [Saccharomycopsis crataegensis]|uniref:tRNA (Uracil(54)-C(5))-methyltransferase n=1 Tax=Saccharomycopsis crataegensis TaxID=43959 RepID=A0AAV5QHS8_9ASCO|nr:tRNA (uracil(54)-C(5))-methyltransferase [Saccharomycopsis crataegensis]